MFKTLPGFREFYPEDCAKKNYILGKWRSAARSFGFAEFEPPVLEQLDLFTEKSGEEIKSQLFEFVDKGGRAVALRPETTPSLARMVGAKAAGIRKPVKWFSIGENYRYERQQKGRLRAFYQFNADILGEVSVNADAEIMALLVESLRSLGLGSNEFKLRLGDRKMWTLFLENLGVAEDRIIPVLSAVDKISKVSTADFGGLLREALGCGGGDVAELSLKIGEFIGISSIGRISPAFGKFRSPELAGSVAARMDDWNRLTGLLKSMGLSDFISVDMGIVRGLAYYTGFVFEAFQTLGSGRALAGGGRYDALVGKLGYQDMPAVGFGMGDVTVANLLEELNKDFPGNYFPDVYVVVSPADSKLRERALFLVSELRRSGFRCDYPLRDSAFGRQFKQAAASGAKFAVVVGVDETASDSVKIKNLETGGEFLCAVSDLVPKLSSMLDIGISGNR